MIRVLKIQQTPILNFRDLQKRFWPAEIFRQMEIFAEFASVHCRPIRTQLADRESGRKYPAEYFTKDFWMGILRRSRWPGEENLMDCFMAAAKAELGIRGNDEERDPEDSRQDEEREAGMKREVRDGGLEEKLAFIARERGSEADYGEVIRLLAICELSEVDPRRLEPWAWKNPETAESGEEPEEISLFPYENTVQLMTGGRVRKFWYHDDDVLAPGARIHTVKVEARGSANQYAVLRIELYSEKTGKCVQSLSLKSGEYRYCSVSRERIIKFLPDVCVSDELCLMRQRYSQKELTVIPKDGESWTLKTEEVTSFAPGSRQQGFLLIQGGKVNSRFYRPAEDYFIRLKMDMLTLPAVEALITETGYAVLLEDGSVASSRPETWKKGIVSLSMEGRAPVLSGADSLSCREAAVSLSGKSLAFLGNEENKHEVLFSGKGRDFSIRERDGRREVWLEEGRKVDVE